MSSYRRVLVALDGSQSAEAVLRFLLEIAGPLDMRVLLLRVLEPMPPRILDVPGQVVVEASRPGGATPRSTSRPSPVPCAPAALTRRGACDGAGRPTRSWPPRARAGPIWSRWRPTGGQV
jgi:hypothetical protein